MIKTGMPNKGNNNAFSEKSNGLYMITPGITQGEE
jgi:hypothetical protein